PCSFSTEFFKIHYDTAGDYPVYHPDEDVDPADGTPDYINRMAEYLELSHYAYITLLGYDLPPPDEGFGGDNLYDIYVGGITGLTVPEFQSDYYPNRQAFASYIYIGNDLRNEFHPDDPLPFLKATCAHEYFHAVQMAYRAFTDDPTFWWYELTANWAEERVFNDLNEVYYYIEDYYLKINHSIYLTGGTHMYGAWVFAEFLSQRHGIDIIRQIFDKLINLDNSMVAIKTILSEHEINFNNEFTIFTVWNYFTHDNYIPGFFEEGEIFPCTVPLSANHYIYPTGWIDTPQSVENLGIAYVYFESTITNKSNLVIEFEADQDYPEEIALIAIYNEQPVEIYTYRLEPEQEITIQVEDFDECEGVVLSINWPYQGYAISDSADYRYSAYIDSIPSGFVSGISSQPDKFRLYGNYPNPFNSSSNIIFHWNYNPIDYNICIYDISGRIVNRLSGLAQCGVNDVNWTPEKSIASGVFYYQLIIGEHQANAKMLLVK
ncbi:MAG TPA: T9SS type A sorting domain-containing protein, partial [candidate division Zixibacteria bacterium]|nr:T9SS type A sorting domain-containing protein [candidate division Zixibacteria bacterium]